MLSPETLEQYRKMTGMERLKLSLQMTEESFPAMFRGTPEEVDRRFELLRKENDERNLNMMTAIAKTRYKSPDELPHSQSAVDRQDVASDEAAGG